MNILLIVASGRSSRFGGFPKAFCKIGNNMNVDNTIQQAKSYYDRFYIGVNRITYAEYKNKIHNCEMFSIITGQGDAHSILKCLEYVKKHESKIDKITVCWGDAVFVDDSPFKQFLQNVGDAKVAVACSLDKKPYAWFELDKNNGIIKSHFARKEGFIEKGMHDQSLFIFDFEFAWEYLNKYREYLKIPYDNDENNTYINEMKLLYSFEYLIKAGYDPAFCVEITPGKVLSFNTQEELKEIKKKVNI